MKLNLATIQNARRHLRSSGPVRRSIIDAVGPFTLQFERDHFGILNRSIISQQISTSAARSIRRRLQELAGSEGCPPRTSSGSRNGKNQGIMTMSGFDRKKTSKKAIDRICGQVKDLLNGFSDEELAWLLFDVDNPEPSVAENEDARKSIEGCRLRNRPWTLDKLSDAAFDFGTTEEPPQELARWLEDKVSLRAFLLERRL